MHSEAEITGIGERVAGRVVFVETGHQLGCDLIGERQTILGV